MNAWTAIGGKGSLMLRALGIFIVLMVVSLQLPLTASLVLVLAGLLLLHIGYAKPLRAATQQSYAEQRRDLTLRREVDEFIAAVRRVYASAMAAPERNAPEAEAAFQRSCEELVARAENIGMVAWRDRSENLEAV